eukprot:4045853-Prorocentrum_lima.AAC.1
MEFVQQHFDESVVHSWEGTRRQGLVLTHWWQTYGDQASLVVNAVHYGKLVACDSHWDSVKLELDVA